MGASSLLSSRALRPGALRDLHPGIDRNIFRREATVVTGLVRKDTDSVIPTIIEVLSKRNFGNYVLTVAYLVAIGPRPFGFGIRMQSELNQARPRCPPPWF